MKGETFIFILIFLQVNTFLQNDYKVIHERISLDWYNRNYVKDMKFISFHYKRYEKRFNFSVNLLQDLGWELTNTGQAYKYQSNEYREFPVLCTFNVCNALMTQQFGIGLTHIETNLTQCPVKKGVYYGANLYLDESKLPPYALRGRYMIEITGHYKKTIRLVSGKWYGEIKPTNPLERVI